MVEPIGLLAGKGQNLLCAWGEVIHHDSSPLKIEPNLSHGNCWCHLVEKSANELQRAS
jgi:hypothetical protein